MMQVLTIYNKYIVIHQVWHLEHNENLMQLNDNGLTLPLTLLNDEVSREPSNNQIILIIYCDELNVF